MMSRVHLPVIGRAATVGELTSANLKDPLLDGFERRIRYLRISVTDRCNYRCSYCMPEDLAGDLHHLARTELLTFEELERLARIFAQLGVRKLRLTGGEPTIRRGIVELVERLVRVPGIDQVVMTTNGHLLDELAQPLAAAGLAGINLSIDTLDPARFAALTGRGDLARVIAGLDAARSAGLRVKLNAVALPELADEAVALTAFAWDRDAVPRFIEHMPMSSGQLLGDGPQRTSRAIREELVASFGELVPVTPSTPDAGPARYWQRTANPAHVVGIISAMSEHFCGDCNRLRLTAAGDLHACLGHDDAVSLRAPLRAGGADADIVRAIAAAVTGKRAGHEFLEAAKAPAKHMIQMGG